MCLSLPGKTAAYKMAETEEESKALLSRYLKRALDELGDIPPALPELCRWTAEGRMGGGNGTVYHSG